jgi:dTDP-4-amino-4,6-dideoxygalactose transaminase
MNGYVPFLDLDPTTRAVKQAVARSWNHLLSDNAFIGGSAVEEFERAWAAYCETGYAVGVANGTDALHLTLRALGIGPGDEVIVPANSFVATAEAVALAGATPCFVDVDQDTLLITAEEVATAINARTRAVIVVHLYGQPVDVDAVTAVARSAGIAVIEDAAQAHGATWHGRRTGSLGTAGCFSFYPGKNLGAFGDAGAVVTSDRALAEELRSLRDHGRVHGSHYDHGVIGTNSRLDSLQAAVLSAKLPHLDDWNERRRRVIERYRTAVAQAGLRLVDEGPGARSVFHLGVVRVPDRVKARRMFETLGIGTGVHYPIPIHRLAPYAYAHRRALPIAEQAADEVVSLPLYPHMTERQITAVCDAIATVAEVLVTEGTVHA